MISGGRSGISGVAADGGAAQRPGRTYSSSPAASRPSFGASPPDHTSPEEIVRSICSRYGVTFAVLRGYALRLTAVVGADSTVDSLAANE